MQLPSRSYILSLFILQVSSINLSNFNISFWPEKNDYYYYYYAYTRRMVYVTKLYSSFNHSILEKVNQMGNNLG